ncbi:MAG: ATP-binding protein [Bauldia sp.]
MKRPSHSFLDLTALPEVGALLLDPRAAWLWSEDGSRLLWANAAGIRTFGDGTAQQAIERRFPASHPVVLQLTSLAPTLKTAEPQMTLLRLPAVTGTEAHLAVATRLPIDEEEDAILIASQQPPQALEPLTGRAFALAAAIAGEGMTAVIVRPDGKLVGSSEGDDLEAVLPALADLAASTSTAGRRILKRRIRFGREQRVIGMAAITAAEGEFRLALIGPAEGASAATDRTSAEARPSPGAAGHAPAGGAKAPLPDDAPLAPPAPGETVPFVFEVRPAPVRFACQLDAEHRFTQISPELAALVGPRSADIVGLRWTDVAKAFHFGAAEAVERLLARRDTWSGVTVYWPIQDSADAVAVDLGALPTFNRAGGFEGFRGFGVCRTSDTRPLSETHEPKPAPIPPPPAEPARPNSNVVRLAVGSPQRDRPLNGNEQDAFRRIATALQPDEDGPDGAPAAPPPEPAAGEAEPAAPSGVAAEAATAAETAAAAAEAPDAAIDTGAGLPIPARFLDRIPLGLLVFRDRSVLFVNRALLTRLGYASRAALVDAGGADILFATAAEASDSDGDGQIHLRAADGEDVALDAKLHIVPWADGSATMLSTRLDPDPAPSPQETAAHAAARSRIDELEAVLDTATDGVAVLDSDGRIESLNRSAEALFGVEAADVRAQPFVNLLAEESRRAALDYFEGLSRSGVASLLNDGREVIGRVPSGGLIPLFMTMGRLAEHGKFCAVLRDMTQWKTAEEELIAARRTAELANRHKSDFLARVSHEIRTPLNAIIGFSEVMLEERFGPIGSDRYREYLKDIRVSGAHLMSLINDLLDLAKIEAGKLELAFTEVSVNDVLQECVALMQPEANRRRIIIRTSLGTAVPPVLADQRSLRQIVLNLMSNAVKFTLAGGQVIVSTAVDGTGDVVLRIRDTGIGMSERDLETALKPFEQVTTTSRGRSDGTGLGLPLTKALVEANRAVFAIDSAPNQGTMAKVTFPARRLP